MIMVMPAHISRRQYLIGLGIVIVAAVGLYGLLPQLGDFSTSWRAIGQASRPYIVLAALLSLITCICSAGLYKLLSFKPLGLFDTSLIQMSGLFVNRILPAGIGGLGLNFLYLRRHRHSVSQATTVVTLNNSLGLIGHLILTILLAIVLALQGGSQIDAGPLVRRLFIGVVVLIAMALAINVILRLQRFSKLRRAALDQFRLIGHHYSQHPGTMMLALGLSCLLTLCNVASLYICSLALGVHINPALVFMIFTLGVAAGTATPTPGGLGGFEAGLAAGFISQHISSPLALAIALLYRFVSYWLGLGLGLVAFAIAQARGLLKE